MWKRIRDWKKLEVERFKKGSIRETTRSHTWIARIWTNEVAGHRDYLLSVPFDTRIQAVAMRKAIVSSRAKYKVTLHKVEQDGEYVV